MIERAVAKDPADRHATAGELIEAARECQGATPAATRVLSDPADRPTLGRAGDSPPIGTVDYRHVGWRDRIAGAPRQWLGVPVAIIAAAIALGFLFR